MRGRVSCPWCNGNAIKAFAKSYMITSQANPSPFPLALHVFEETHVDLNLYRWVVFVLWLKTHRNAWRWYRIIQKAHPDTVPSIPTLWDECQKVWHLERKTMSRNNG